MIAKKNSRYNLEQKRTALFQIGLLTVGSLVLAAFTYKSPVISGIEKSKVASTELNYTYVELNPEKEIESKVVKQQNDQSNDDNQLQQDNAPPSDDSKAVKNTGKKPDTGITGELGIPEGPDMGGVVIIPDDDTVDEFPAIPTEYIGGITAMKSFINNKVRYPEEDRILGNQGRVYVSFIIEKDGSISNVGIERGVSEGLDREAKRLVRSFPNWKPAENVYGTVRTRVRLPINFFLGE